LLVRVCMTTHARAQLNRTAFHYCYLYVLKLSGCCLAIQAYRLQAKEL
jgi:hypothetical protein